MVSLLLVLGCTSRPAPLPAGDAARPDLVLVSVDTLRADHLSSYGYDRPTSPFMDALAAQGVRFSAARSPAPWTLPAHTTMLTGQLPSTHRVVEDDLRLDPATPVLPERLRAAGYQTGGFVGTLYVSRVFGFERGFDRFEDFGLHDEKSNLSGEVVASEVVDEALRWLGSLPAGAPAFVFLHVYDVHYTYDPPAPYDTLFDRAPLGSDARYKNYQFYKKRPPSAEQLAHQTAQYDEAIRYVSDQLARLRDAMVAAGRKSRWVVTADHGEELGERGSWGHAHTLYAEQLHVPLIVSGDGLPAGRVVDGPVGLQDVAPTMLAWAGGAGLAADGVDLGPALGGAALPERAMLSETSRFDSDRVGLYQGGLRLEWDLVTGRRELFDDLADPRETTDLSAQRPDDVARLSASLEAALMGWVADQAGEARTEGALLRGGAFKTLTVAAGERFALMPHDANLTFTPAGGASAGPWAAVGGVSPPAGAPVRLLRASGASDVLLDEAQKQALEALGYVQGD